MLYRPSRSNITLGEGPCINLCQKKIRWEKLIHITLHLRPLLSHRCVLAVPFPRTVPLPPSIPFLCPSNSRVPFHCVPGIPHIPFHSCSIPFHPTLPVYSHVPFHPVPCSVPFPRLNRLTSGELSILAILSLRFLRTRDILIRENLKILTEKT